MTCTAGRAIPCTRVTMAGPLTEHGLLPVLMWCNECRARLREGRLTRPHLAPLLRELEVYDRPTPGSPEDQRARIERADLAAQMRALFTTAELRWLAKVSARAQLRARPGPT